MSVGMPGEGFGARVEIIPTAGIVGEVAAHLPSTTTITVTCLPHHGVERTMTTALELAGRGYSVVPHLAARSISSRAQLAGIVRQCLTAGITEVFAIGGDRAQPAGPYAWSGALMADVAELAGGALAMGVGGYPEGHPGIDDAQLLDSLATKAELASCIVTQMCFSAVSIEKYVATLRHAGIDLPVWAGVAGAVPRARLLSLGAKIGVGSSLRFISGKGALGLRLMGGVRYEPQELIAELAARSVPLAGIHHYSFNNLLAFAPAPA